MVGQGASHSHTSCRTGNRMVQHGNQELAAVMKNDDEEPGKKRSALQYITHNVPKPQRIGSVNPLLRMHPPIHRDDTIEGKRPS